MSNIRLFFSESLSINLTAKLDKSQSHYVNKVMRIKVNEVFSLFNSNGEWEAKILEISKSIVEFNVTKQLRQKENTKELWLAFSPIKSNYLNFMIQKATELGVTKFLPIIFDRTVVRKINKERIEKVIIEAAEQSNRINLPSIEEPQNLKYPDIGILSAKQHDQSLAYAEMLYSSLPAIGLGDRNGDRCKYYVKAVSLGDLQKVAVFEYSDLTMMTISAEKQYDNNSVYFESCNYIIIQTIPNMVNFMVIF
jgi:RsmE family RNA methyltransferase